MIQLIVDNSYSQVTGLTTEQFRALRKLLSYQTDSHAAYFSGGRTYTKYMIDKKGFFPSGLLTKVHNWLVMDMQLDIKKLNINKKPRKLANFPKLKLKHEPYDCQRTARVRASLFQRGCISMPTGTGKSVVIAMIIATFKVKTLIVVPTLELKNQLKETLASYFGNTRLITVENIDSKNLKKPRDYDCLIIDEAHHVAAKTYQTLNKTVWSGIYHRFFLTATAFRNKDEEKLLFEGIAGRILYKLSYEESVRKKYIVPVEAYYVDLPKQKTDAYTWAQVYSELVVNNDYRNGKIAGILEGLYTEGNHTLCLVKEIAHGKKLSELTDIPFVNGQDEDSRFYIQHFNEGKRYKWLIGTTGILGEGVDTKPCEYVIIAGLGKAKSQFMQQVGRAVRNYPGKESAKIILFRDTSHKFTLRHFKEQCKILKEEYGIEVVKL